MMTIPNEDKAIEDTLFENVHKIVFKNVSDYGVLKGSSKFADLQHDIMKLIKDYGIQSKIDELEKARQLVATGVEAYPEVFYKRILALQSILNKGEK